MPADAQLTPMMAQYRRVKSELPSGTLLLFRLGDFYEMFFEDAQLGAQLLNLALTRRNGTPMCGLPYHAAAGYIGRLLKSGKRVAVCDQLEDPKPGKLVKREVTQVLSPGAHFDERMLSAERSNYLAAVCARKQRFGLALVDLTTADFRTAELDGEAVLMSELQRLRPAEILLPAEAVALADLLRGSPRSQDEAPVGSGGAPSRLDAPEKSAWGWVLTPYEDWVFAPETAQFTLLDHFKVATLDGFGLRSKLAAVGAGGAVLHYLANQLRRDLSHLTRLSCYEPADFLVLDSTTLRHLEVLEPLHREAPREACLYGAVNRTVSPMGARRLRDWLSQPLASLDRIRERQDAIQTWCDHPAQLERFRTGLREVRDLERTLSRLSVGTGNARDLVALRIAIAQVPGLREQTALLAQPLLSPSSAALQELPLPASPTPPPPAHLPPLLTELSSQLTGAPDLVDLLSRAMVDDPPLALKEGSLIRDGFDAGLDELRAAARGGKDWVARLQQQEIERTRIPSLKVRFNSVFGYYIEVTKANLDKVPADYVRKQTIASGERFITPELKAMEGKILGAEERAMKIEYELFLRVREAVLSCRGLLQQTAHALGQLDVLAALAETARLHQYHRPELNEQGRLLIRDGRHPVLEQQLAGERFVPNDTDLDSEARQIALITGPNMAGKSTYIRQVALLALLAHTGSFIPAAEASIDRLDRIFTRIGASDDLARGQSTFMVEMTETANILNHATPHSLVVLDEIGRGTSTFDGLSLAWSIIEHLHHRVGSKTLFATHYHELTELASRLPRVRNYNIAVREWKDQIVFLRKIVPGGADKSYGIQVARLAGVPKEVLDRAKTILRNLEASELTPEGDVRHPSRQRTERDKLQNLPASPQLDLFG